MLNKFLRCCLLPVAFLVFLAPALCAETLTIATYNVENYLSTNRLTEDGFKNYPKPEKEKAALRVIIKQLDADILAIQEMGDLPYFKELRASLKKDGVDYPYAELLTGPAIDQNRHLAILSRRPLTRVGRHDDLGFRYFGATETVKRGLLEVHVDTKAGDLGIFVVHLKSRITDRPDDQESTIRRNAEAAAIRDRILKLYPDPADPGARFIILGDFNDTRDTRTLRSLIQRGKKQIAQPLPGADTRGEVWTHYYAKQDSYTRFDHILVSPPLRNAVENRAVTICDAPETRIASDHRPVVVRLTLGD
jgi:endonuclease/exonuclease/phosphatase family metal-dependent hydrolase